MYLWYGLSRICYAYLADVPSGEDPRAEDSAFRKSRWYSRGWTLQELIAPHRVIFLSKDWDTIGTKHTLVDVVEEITGIPCEALSHMKPLDEFSVAQRLSWASRRQTTRAEDQAYSLLGIFDINMPPLYGEGDRAFRRLQEEIVRRFPDQSLFAWEEVFVDLKPSQDLAQCSSLRGDTVIRLDYRSGHVLFAWDPSSLINGGGIRAVSHDDVFRRLQLSQLPAPQYTFTPHGIQTHLPVVLIDHCLPHSTITYPNYDTESRWYLAILGCEHTDDPGALLGRVCYISPSHSGVEYLYCEHANIDPEPSRGPQLADLFPLSPATIERVRKHIQLKTVYVSHPGRAGIRTDDSWTEPHDTIILVLPKKNRDDLRARGYRAELRRPDEYQRTATHRLTLFDDDHTITVEYQHTLEDDGRGLIIEAHVKMSRPLRDSHGEIEAAPNSVRWQDRKPWCSSLDAEEVVFALATKKLVVKLGFDWAEPSCYFIYADIVTDPLATSPQRVHEEGLQGPEADCGTGVLNAVVEDDGGGDDIPRVDDDTRPETLDSVDSAILRELRDEGEEREASLEKSVEGPGDEGDSE
ncbi:hypothetical protein BD310DRAFT_941894 [Dichomitus squalens]|uniref:DUF8212 domain-containing protein n=1 Tax=Dichomitus squalens TaxID=114155 RepID=A0A4Q9PEE3_9APHY|nr:hypothetical protein BD310DRAFT_941894 [Dichomitus squalens]